MERKTTPSGPCSSQNASHTGRGQTERKKAPRRHPAYSRLDARARWVAAGGGMYVSVNRLRELGLPDYVCDNAAAERAQVGVEVRCIAVQ